MINYCSNFELDLFHTKFNMKLEIRFTAAISETTTRTTRDRSPQPGNNFANFKLVGARMPVVRGDRDGTTQREGHGGPFVP